MARPTMSDFNAAVMSMSASCFGMPPTSPMTGCILDVAETISGWAAIFFLPNSASSFSFIVHTVVGVEPVVACRNVIVVTAFWKGLTASCGRCRLVVDTLATSRDV